MSCEDNNFHRSVQAELVLDARAHLGEGPRWLPEREDLLWLDIEARRVHLTETRTRIDLSWPVAEDVGLAAPRNEAEAILATRRGLFVLDYDSGAMSPLIELDLASDVRFNDGFCDPLGRLWAGAMAADHRPSGGALMRIDPDGRVSVEVEDVRLSNGIGLSPDNDRLYYIDSLCQRVDVFDFDLEHGRLTRRRTLVEIDPADGIPDGLSVDSEGGVWVAIFGGGSVRRYTARGELDAEVMVPARNVTACAFGDEDLGTMYITTATWTPDGYTSARGAGGLFAARPGVRGIAAGGFGG